MERMPAKPVLLFGLLFGPCAAAAESPDIQSAWPFFYYSKGPERTEFEGLGPLLFYQNGPEGRSYGLRPLFGFRHEAEADRSFWQVLYPLSYFRREGQAAHDFFFPVYFHYRATGPDGRPVHATVVFPLAAWGRSAKGGPWASSPLLGGTLHGFLGADKFSYLANLYIRMRTGDYVTYHVLWPFFTWSHGPGRRAIRIWPLFGSAEKEGHWRNGYVLWPLFNYGTREASEAKNAADYFCFYPFFGRSRGRDGRSGSYLALWPFFYYGWNDHKHLREWSAPFPLFYGKSTDDSQEINVWPFWGRRTTKAGAETKLLASLIRHSSVRTSNARIETLSIYPLFGYARSEDAKRGARRSFWLLWPLVRSRSRQAGDERWGDANSLQLAWFQYPGDFDRNYNALLGLFEHERTRDGRRSTRLLWRLFRSESGPGWRHVQLGPLASWHRSPRLTRASFLLGLLQTGKRDGKRGWRVFYVPFGAPLIPPGGERAHGS